MLYVLYNVAINRKTKYLIFIFRNYFFFYLFATLIINNLKLGYHRLTSSGREHGAPLGLRACALRSACTLSIVKCTFGFLKIQHNRRLPY